MKKDINAKGGFTFDWYINNFNFCWHKTGEYLESRSFYIDISGLTSWRLWLYPRGEDDGEYISCYLFREEGGPNVVDVDFELSLLIGDITVKPSVSFLKIYSFKNGQREGLKCFASRWEVFSPMAASHDTFTLLFRCKILNVPEDGFKGTDSFGHTNIRMERIFATEMFEGGSDLKPESSKDIEVASLLGDDPLININLSYFEDCLKVKIHPNFCEKIKYAICKIVVIKEWTNENPEVHEFSWVGKVKPDVWKCSSRLEAESVKEGFETISNKIFFLSYEFAFSTGIEIIGKNLETYCSCIEIPDAFSRHYSKKLSEMVKSAPTAFTTLKSLCGSESYSDVNIASDLNIVFPAHKAILCARSSKLKSIFTYFNTDITLEHFDDDCGRKFLQFMYTDILEDPTLKIAIELYQTGVLLAMEGLKTKCKTYITNNLSVQIAILLLWLSDVLLDLSLYAAIQSYIVTYYDLIIVTESWKNLLKRNNKLAKEIMLLKYKRLHSFW